ncbi:hypothetical protein GINT2_000080 [Glugoides intestinalis]
MDKQTEMEVKVVKIISKILAIPIQKEPELAKSLKSVSLAPHTFSEDLPKIIVVTMPLDLLIYAKLHSKELINTLKKDLPKYMIVMKRISEVPEAKVFNPLKCREKLIEDLVFPATVAGRSNEVESMEDMTQVVYLDSKNQCWSKPELSALEKLLCTSFEQTFKVRIFGSGF